MKVVLLVLALLMADCAGEKSGEIADPVATVVAGGVLESTLTAEQQSVVDTVSWIARAEALDGRVIDLYRDVCDDEGREALIVEMERPEKLYTAWDELVAREWANRGHLSWEVV